MGSVLRAAGCYQVSSIYYTGTRYDRARHFVTDTKNRYLNITPTHVDDLIAIAKHQGLKTVVVELVVGAIPLPDYDHPPQALYIFGPEDGSIDQNIINQCDDIVYIPTIGCMNLAATVNVLLYDRMAKQPNIEFGDDLIIASRDTNNRTKSP
ncbi:TrmH family RNA methyltransferase [Paraglaciecola hydrolytica]|uniref:23S rRNA methyltransferase n=1 Tax=Paraglaciecola hydrolytica TaxID=1799789 RepID=A0A136A6N4_9ALTE|nr:23S rRNA methyltransferase [Paraglaciecola hydrolytica]